MGTSYILGMGQESSRMGYRILEVAPNSPLAKLHVEPMLDFIMLPEGNPFLCIEENFLAQIAKFENKELELTLYNIATQSQRKLKVIPRKSNGSGLLGLRLRLEESSQCHKRVVQVQNILVDSPMHKAGLQPFHDFILGTQREFFRSISQFVQFVHIHNHSPLVLWVYNSETGRCRRVTLIPNDKWGGNGYLGGDIGFGSSHAIPIRRSAEAELEVEVNPKKQAYSSSTEEEKTEARKVAEHPHEQFNPRDVQGEQEAELDSKSGHRSEEQTSKSPSLFVGDIML